MQVHVTFKFGAQCFNHKQMQVSKIQEHFGRKAFKTSSGSIWALVTNMLAHNYGYPYPDLSLSCKLSVLQGLF